MTREEEITRAANAASEYESPSFFDAFVQGAEWADAHPHWISVEEELPPIGGIVLVAIPLGGELSVLPLLIENENDFECLKGMTHWMPMPQAPKKGGEK